MTVRRAPSSLKDAIARAAGPLGGVTNASLAIGANRFMLAHAANPNKPDMVRFDDAIELSRLCKEASGETPLLDYFAAELDGVPVPDVDWHAHMASLAREGGDAVASIAHALSDGQISDRNLEDMLAETRELGAAARRLERRLVSEIKAREGKNG